jgi:hypothetical protein
VYVWFKDDSGNVSGAQSDAIYRFNSNFLILMIFLLQVVLVIG